MLARLFDLQNPVPLIIAAAVAVLFIGLLLFLLVRHFTRKADRRAADQEDRAATEREWQFSAAAEQLSYLKDPSEVAKELSSLLREYLSMNVLAVYAGRPQDVQISNILVAGEGSVRPTSQIAQSLPVSFPATLMAEYRQPRLTNLQSLIGSGSGEVSGQRSYQTSELAEGGAPHPGRARMAEWQFFPGTVHLNGWAS